MARYILIDNCSGYIWGDTADVGGKALSLGTGDEDIVAACRTIDTDVGDHGRDYEILSRTNTLALAGNETGYLVYRADVRGSEQVAVITDGQDQEMIDAVSRDCELVAVVKCSDAE